METYKGSYTVKPKINKKRRLKTRKKIASHNITVKEIQKEITSNSAGGETIYFKKDGEIDGI